MLVKVGDGGKWTSTITNSAVGTKIEALTKPECIYNICEGLLGSPPSYSSFTKWFSYPVNHPEISTMTANLEHTLELLPLQNHLDRQLFTNRVEVMLEVHISKYLVTLLVTVGLVYRVVADCCSTYFFYSFYFFILNYNLFSENIT